MMVRTKRSRRSTKKVAFADLDTLTSCGTFRKLPRSTTLPLPNDLLLPIFEEVYKARGSHESRIADILINKQIFLVARTFWFSHLLIADPRTDEKLTSLKNDDFRCRHLQSLEIRIGDFSHLTEVLLSHPFPMLSHLLISHDGSKAKFPFWAVRNLVARLENLRHLELRLENCTDLLCYPYRLEAALKHTRNHSLSITYYYNKWLWRRITANSVEVGRFDKRLDASFWSELNSFELLPGWKTPGIDRLVGTLEAAVAKYQDIPLQRVALAVQYGVERDPSYFSISSFTRFLELLSKTSIKQLEFNFASFIPEFNCSQSLANSVKALRLSGQLVLLQEKFQAKILRLIERFPSLERLHIIDTSLTEHSPVRRLQIVGEGAAETLIPVLQCSSVVTLVTYRSMADREKEMRWTRRNSRGRFSEETWTL